MTMRFRENQHRGGERSRPPLLVTAEGSSEEDMMRTFTISLLAGVGALAAASGAKASDIYTTSEYTNPDLVQQVRLVCDDAGRCYRTRGGSRVIVRDSYDSTTTCRATAITSAGPIIAIGTTARAPESAFVRPA